MSYVKILEYGAIDSKGNASHWFRYLRKIIKEDEVLLSPDDTKSLLNSDKLSLFQKVTLERAVIKGSPTFNYVVSLNKPAKRKYLSQLREVLNDQGFTGIK